ncbi:MAG: hypothetical protein ACE10G_09920 [Gemmatimonadales bacterium]
MQQKTHLSEWVTERIGIWDGRRSEWLELEQPTDRASGPDGERKVAGRQHPPLPPKSTPGDPIHWWPGGDRAPFRQRIADLAHIAGVEATEPIFAQDQALTSRRASAVTAFAVRELGKETRV